MRKLRIFWPLIKYLKCMVHWITRFTRFIWAVGQITGDLNAILYKLNNFFSSNEIIKFSLYLKYSQPLLGAKQKRHTNLIIDCSYERLTDVLKQTQEVGMMTDSYRYIVTSLVRVDNFYKFVLYQILFIFIYSINLEYNIF